MRKFFSFTLAILITASYSFCVQADPINSTLKDNANKQLQQNQAQLDAAQNNLSQLQSAIESLDSQIEKLMSDIDSNKNAINKSEQDVSSAKQEVETAENSMKEQQQLFDSRVRASYESGTEEYLDILLSSNNFTDFLSKIDNINRIVSYDNKVAEELKSKKQELQNKQKSLENKNIELKNLLAQNNAQLDQLNTKKQSQAQLISEAKQQTNLLAAQVQKDKDILNAAIAEMDNQAIDLATNVSSSLSDIDSALSYLNNRAKQINLPAITQAISKGNVLKQAKKTEADRGSIGPVSGLSVALYAERFLGTPYLWGGTRPYVLGDPTSGFDCSGLVQYCYKQFGIYITRTTYTQIKADGKFVDKSVLQPGDLLFFGTWDDPHHVGMYIGDGRFIQAPQTGDVVKISNLADRDDFLAAKRIIN